MNWLFKEEPANYSFDALLKDKRTVWSGVKNPLAQKHLHAVRRGDRILYYHTGNEKAVVGIAKALGDAYPDPGDKTGKHAVVDVGPVRKLGPPGDARRNQGRRRVQGLSACPDFAVVGDAGHGRGVDTDRTDGRTGGRGRKGGIGGRAGKAEATAVATLNTSLVLLLRPILPARPYRWTAFSAQAAPSSRSRPGPRR